MAIFIKGAIRPFLRTTLILGGGLFLCAPPGNLLQETATVLAVVKPRPFSQNAAMSGSSAIIALSSDETQHPAQRCPVQDDTAFPAHPRERERESKK